MYRPKQQPPGMVPADLLETRGAVADAALSPAAGPVQIVHVLRLCVLPCSEKSGDVLVITRLEYKARLMSGQWRAGNNAIMTRHWWQKILSQHGGYALAVVVVVVVWARSGIVVVVQVAPLVLAGDVGGLRRLLSRVPNSRVSGAELGDEVSGSSKQQRVGQVASMISAHGWIMVVDSPGCGQGVWPG